ncbi:MAG: NUDIX domain-containing protein [Methylobacteriaceae bacterium]|nr:NUDIX domain-containing protein [Methylobacteriaceae bacterium]MBV9247453.1 NUDIX domain-containing protein [Methylobacteriaceae bacterium]
MNDGLRTPGLATRLAFRAAMFVARYSRWMLLGVRGIVLDEAQGVFLVRHSYVAGWHLPGGGVEVGETVHDALARELAEEGNIVIDGAPVLHGVFFNRTLANRDHIAVFLVRRFHQTAARLPDREIADCGFFPLDRLPEGTTRPVRARLAEAIEGAPAAASW